MEIGPSTMAAREVALNKQNVRQDILQKTLEKDKELQQKEVTENLLSLRPT
jgi:hypothetical protein